MDIREEEVFAQAIIREARKLNPAIGCILKTVTPPLSSDLEIKVTNEIVRVNRLTLSEFKRKGNNTPKGLIEDVASPFELDTPHGSRI